MLMRCALRAASRVSVSASSNSLCSVAVALPTQAIPTWQSNRSFAAKVERAKDDPHAASKSFDFVYEANLSDPTAARANEKSQIPLLKKAKPTTPGQRHLVQISRHMLHKGRPIHQLTEPLKKTAGRNNQGRITVSSRGGGHKRRYRLVDFKRSILDVEGVVQRLEYDPNRSAHIALVRYPDGRLQYIIAPQNVGPGDVVKASRTQEVEIRPGNAMPIGMMPVGTVFHCLELLPGRGAQLARSAGTSCILLSKEQSRKTHVLVRIASREQRLVPRACMATVGVVSNPLHRVRSLGKAGRSRWLGFRPHTRGLAMNPVDHPHGGGGGRGRVGRPSCSPTAQLAKGFKTRSPHKNNALIVVKRGGPVKATATKMRAIKVDKSGKRK